MQVNPLWRGFDWDCRATRAAARVGTVSKGRLLLRQGSNRQEQVTRGNHGSETDETDGVKVACHCDYLERVQIQKGKFLRRSLLAIESAAQGLHAPQFRIG